MGCKTQASISHSECGAYVGLNNKQQIDRFFSPEEVLPNIFWLRDPTENWGVLQQNDCDENCPNWNAKNCTANTDLIEEQICQIDSIDWMTCSYFVNHTISYTVTTDDALMIKFCWVVYLIHLLDRLQIPLVGNKNVKESPLCKKRVCHQNVNIQTFNDFFHFCIWVTWWRCVA